MADQLEQIEIGKIDDTKHGLRVAIPDDAIVQLAQSIGRLGLLVPIDVYKTEEGYNLVAGHRRLAAMRWLGWKKVPAFVRNSGSSSVASRAAAENLCRADISPLEEAACIKDMVESEGMETDEIAAACGRSQQWVLGRLELLEWPGDVAAAVHAGQLSAAAASHLAVIPDETYRKFLLKQAVNSGATARITSSWRAAWESSEPPDEAVQAEPVPAPERAQPMISQAPCFLCGEFQRLDSLSRVMVCTNCQAQVLNARRGGQQQQS